MKRRSTGDHAVAACDVVGHSAATAVVENACSVIKRGRHPEHAQMYDPQALGKRLYAIRFERFCSGNRRTDIVSTLTVIEKRLAKLSREEIEIVEQLHRLDPARLAQIDESTSDWKTR